MRLGIDFGTTRTVVAVADRGNYPVVSFHGEGGDSCDFFPSVLAERDGELRFGFDALAQSQDASWTIVRSFKRSLGDTDTSPTSRVTVGGSRCSLLDLTTRFLGALREAILSRSNLPRRLAGDARLEVVVATPANALGAQRFVTLEAFRRAGFDVLSIMNEPSAAGFEYTHRHGSTLNSKREHVVVYDLGGGTFDASLVRMSGKQHEALTTSGEATLGGDDFDVVLADLALAAAKLERAAVPERALGLLLEQCREAKERLNPSSRKVTLDLEACLGEAAPVADVTVTTQSFYAASEPLVERTIEAMLPVMRRLDAEDPDGTELRGDIAGIYVVGGASSLPIIGRKLRERFGRRVHRSPYPSAATAIGLAIAADEGSGFALSDRFSRNFGVFREGAGGRNIVFDPIFTRDTLLPRAKTALVTLRRAYRAAHNLGHYRFVECQTIGDDGTPVGEIAPFADVLFPFDEELRTRGDDLAKVLVRRMPGDGPRIEERYSVDENGTVEVTIADLDSGYERAYRLG